MALLSSSGNTSVSFSDIHIHRLDIYKHLNTCNYLNVISI
jgi:hypothetical protein